MCIKKWSKMMFSKVVLTPFGAHHKQVVLSCLEVFSTHISPCKFHKALTGPRPKKDQKGVKTTFFPKMTLNHLGR